MTFFIEGELGMIKSKTELLILHQIVLHAISPFSFCFPKGIFVNRKFFTTHEELLYQQFLNNDLLSYSPCWCKFITIINKVRIISSTKHMLTIPQEQAALQENIILTKKHRNKSQKAGRQSGHSDIMAGLCFP